MEFRAQILLRSMWFWAVIGMSAGANIWTYLHTPACCDRLDGVGFPVPFHISGGIAGGSSFFVFSLLLDVVVTLTVATIAARVQLALRGEKSRH